jgi:hypothetical protein
LSARALLALCVSLAAAAGCESASNDPGLDALMRVANAQFYRGAPPAATDGPAIQSFNNSSNAIIPGQRSKPLSGLATPDTGAIALYLDGDRGYWIVLPGAADATALDQLTFSASLSFSPAIAPGAYTLVGRAVGLDGRFGPPETAQLTASADVPPGARLVITLAWDVNADLDLHVVPPDGVEIWAKHINSWEPMPGGDPLSGGILDFDSNSQCAIDGRRREHVTFMSPPSGHYVARVDTFSLCGEPLARWTLTATLDGNLLASALGPARDTDAAMPHEQGAGVLAAEFDVP